MKNLFLFLMIAAGLLASCSNDKQRYADYNDAVLQQVKVADSTLGVLFEFTDFEEFPSMQDTYVASFNQLKKELNEISWEEEDSLRQTAIELVQTYTSIVEDEYYGIYVLLHDTLYTREDSLLADSLSAEMYVKWQVSSERFASVQNSFAKKHGLELKK